MDCPRLTLRRLLAHAVLGLLLVFGQQYAARHWLSHAIEAAQSNAKGAPAGSHCSECDGLVAFGAALTSPPAPAAPVLEFDAGIAPAPESVAPVAATTTGYLSRAPPLFG